MKYVIEPIIPVIEVIITWRSIVYTGENINKAIPFKMFSRTLIMLIFEAYKFDHPYYYITLCMLVIIYISLGIKRVLYGKINSKISWYYINLIGVSVIILTITTIVLLRDSSSKTDSSLKVFLAAIIKYSHMASGLMLAFGGMLFVGDIFMGKQRVLEKLKWVITTAVAVVILGVGIWTKMGTLVLTSVDIVLGELICWAIEMPGPRCMYMFGVLTCGTVMLGLVHKNMTFL